MPNVLPRRRRSSCSCGFVPRPHSDALSPPLFRAGPAPALYNTNGASREKSACPMGLAPDATNNPSHTAPKRSAIPQPMRPLTLGAQHQSRPHGPVSRAARLRLYRGPEPGLHQTRQKKRTTKIALHAILTSGMSRDEYSSHPTLTFRHQRPVPSTCGKRHSVNMGIEMNVTKKVAPIDFDGQDIVS